MRTIAVVNQKGGCGKTTTAINLSAFLAREGRRTLLVDLDPQGHATLGLFASHGQVPLTTYHLFAGEDGRPAAPLRDIVQPVLPNLDLAPADILLSAAPERLAGVAGRERVLADALSTLAAAYDYAVIDCPPNVGLLTFNALMACSEAIVPLDPSFFALHGLGKLFETIDLVARKTGHEIQARVLVTLYTGRTQFARHVLEEVRRHVPDRHFATVIRHSVKLAEAASHAVPVASYSTTCVGFEDYRALAAEVIALETELPLREREAAAQQESGGADVPTAHAPRLTALGVDFAIDAPEAVRVHLVGDFNDWSLDAGDMQRRGRIWARAVPLAPGRYRYRFVVDGHWITDPLNPDIEPDPYGGHNSVLVIAADAAAAAGGVNAA